MTLEPISIPLWGVGVVLVGFPLAYLLYDLTPWARRLWGAADRSSYLRYWAGVAVLQWASVLAVTLVLIERDYRLASIGLVVPESPLVLAASTLLLALTVVGYSNRVIAAEELPSDQIDMPSPGGYLPITRRERTVRFFSSGITDGICGEIVYRGFAILALLGFGMPWWGAVILASIPAPFVNGLAALNPVTYASHFVVAVVFAGIFLATGSLFVPIVLHVAMTLLLTIRNTQAELS